MALQLTGTWEQALIASTLQTASELEPDGYLGRTALQKIMYFLQIAGVPMRYGFDLHHFGPYCDLIPRDVEWLQADGVLEDASSDPTRYSNYRTTNEAGELIGLHQARLDQYHPKIEGVVKALSPLRPERLEVLATLDYLYRELRAGGGPDPWKERVIDSFIKVKGDRFDRDTASSVYDALVGADLIQA